MAFDNEGNLKLEARTLERQTTVRLLSRIVAAAGRAIATMIIVSIGVLNSVSTSAFAAPSIESNLVQLEWRVMAGDDPAWRENDFDDSGWRVLQLEQADRHGLTAGNSGMFWYRVQIPGSILVQFENPAVYLGRISDADQAYFNGKLIGSTGEIYKSAQGYQGTGPAHMTRVYPIERAAIESGPNVLALRIQTAQYASGLGQGPMYLGELTQLSKDAQE